MSQSFCNILHSDQHCLTVSAPPHSHQFGMVSLLKFSHSNRNITGISFGFNVHFPNGDLCWTYFHVLICHLCIFFVEVFVQIFCPFLSWAFSLLLNFKTSLHILKISPLSDKCFVRIFLLGCGLSFHSYNYL